MYNATLALNYFPDAWKEGELVHFGKPGKSVDDPSGYRPITLLSINGKIQEKLLLRKIKHDLSNATLLSGRQRGFTENGSTETALEQVLPIIELQQQKQNYVTAISVDFKGAFENLPCKKTINSLKNLNIKTQYINILSSFLHNRSARVDWMNPSAKYYFSKGCPQGSCSGAILWNSLRGSCVLSV